MSINSTGFFLTATVVDQGGNQATLRYELVAADFAAAETAAAGILTFLDAVSGAQVVSYRVGEAFAENADFYGAGEIENIAQITSKLVTDGKTANIKIPAPLDGVFVAASGPDYNVVDPADAAVINYVSIWEAGSGYATLSDGESVRDSATAGNFYGKRIHRGSRKG